MLKMSVNRKKQDMLLNPHIADERPTVVVISFRASSSMYSYAFRELAANPMASFLGQTRYVQRLGCVSCCAA